MLTIFMSLVFQQDFACFRLSVNRLRSEPVSCLRENQHRDNEICFGIKCASVAVKICSGKVDWLLLILILIETNSFTSIKFWSFIGEFTRLQLFLKNASSQTFPCNTSS